MESAALQKSMLTRDDCHFFFNDAAPTEIYTLSLHDALPICRQGESSHGFSAPAFSFPMRPFGKLNAGDRKSTRLNSSHMSMSYAVFCLKKKKNNNYA